LIPRLKNQAQFPITAAAGLGNLPQKPDLITDKLAALHFYQLAIPAPSPPKDSFNKEATTRGMAVFNGKATCTTCHVPPLFTEPGWSLHTPRGNRHRRFSGQPLPGQTVSDYAAARPLVRMKGGFYHDGRFATLQEVVNHYDTFFNLKLNEAEKADLTEYLKSL
jgi:hypothetical protein